MTIGIITIIGREFDAICREFEIDKNDSRKIYNHGDLYFRKKIISNFNGNEIDVIVTFQKKAGNITSGISATKLIERFSPDFLFLCGIAAGFKDSCKIGDVVVSKVIGNNTTKLFEKGILRPRYESISIQSSIENNMFLFAVNTSKWKESLEGSHTGFLNESEYNKMDEDGRKIVSEFPEVKDHITVAADVLIRDPLYFEVLMKEVNDKIRAADMESAGFASACEQREPRTPWLVVRGISDFGDESKRDNFHNRAASVAASWLGFFVRNGFDPSHYVELRNTDFQAAPPNIDLNTNEVTENATSIEEVSTIPVNLLANLKATSENINKDIRNED